MIHSWYSDSLHIYTDGSKISDPHSSSSAVYFPSLSITHTWKHPSTHSILTAELYAIFKALEITLSSLPPQPVTNFSDSLSSLHILTNHSPHTHRALCFQIHTLISHSSTNPSWDIKFQWVPSHINIPGNTVADKAAALAHSLPHVTPSHLETHDYKNEIHRVTTIYWNQHLSDNITTTTLGNVRITAKPHPWTYSTDRHLDTAITRLRIGHCGLNAHVHRLGMILSPDCPWCRGTPETIDHFLLHCPRHYSHRTHLRHSLAALGIHNITSEFLLGSEQLPDTTNFKIIHFLQKFLKETGHLHRI